MSKGTEKSLHGIESAPGPEAVIGGKRHLYFAGTSYFGLHGRAELIRAGIKAFQKYGTHSATSRAGFGNNPVLLAVEEQLRKFFGEPEAAYFGSGYLSSLVLAQSLAEKYDVIFIDEAAHFCILDSVHSLGKPVYRFRHCDPEDLSRKLKTRLKPRQTPFLMTDGVFPTFGDIAPVLDYIDVLRPYTGMIGLDDAHGVGVLGPRGRGTYDHFGVSSGNLHLAGTLSKAFGGHGGFLVGGKKLIAGARRTVGAYIGSTPTPTPIAAAAAKGIEILRNHPEMRERLRKNVALVKAGMKKLGIPVNNTPVPIVAWTTGSAKRMKKIQKLLLDRGLAIAYLRYVGAPAEGVLRVTVFSTHTADQIRHLLLELARAL